MLLLFYDWFQTRLIGNFAGVWGNWGDWGECTVSCGGGEQTRSEKDPFSSRFDQMDKSDKYKTSNCVICNALCRLRTCPDNACKGEAEEKRDCASGESLSSFLRGMSHPQADQAVFLLSILYFDIVVFGILSLMPFQGIAPPWSWLSCQGSADKQASDPRGSSMVSIERIFEHWQDCKDFGDCEDFGDFEHWEQN